MRKILSDNSQIYLYIQCTPCQSPRRPFLGGNLQADPKVHMEIQKHKIVFMFLKNINLRAFATQFKIYCNPY